MRERTQEANAMPCLANGPMKYHTSINIVHIGGTGRYQNGGRRRVPNRYSGRMAGHRASTQVPGRGQCIAGTALGASEGTPCDQVHDTFGNVRKRSESRDHFPS
jgi:hypothetical protein